VKADRFTRGRKAHILLVEDDESVGNYLVRVLGRLGDVHWSTDAEQAKTVVRGSDWDLIVSDIELPGMNGLDFVRATKIGQPLIATLILSGHSSFEHAVAALRVGADDYATKPIEAEALLKKARALIEITRERRSTSAEIVLAVGAHPGDVEIGVGGILLRHVAEGHTVTVLTLTGGAAAGAIEDRLGESSRAAALMSARLVHADLEEMNVGEGDRTIATVKGVIDELRPTVVYAHSIHDLHQDPRNAHRATLVAARRVPKVFCYQASSSSTEFRPTRFVAIDAYLRQKLEVIQAYASQVKVRDYLDDELLRSTARYWARFAHARYVEPLEVVRDSEAHASATSDPILVELSAGTAAEAR
jgi:LmbE family N-acetylglucosaminyl deacetylase